MPGDEVTETWVEERTGGRGPDPPVRGADGLAAALLDGPLERRWRSIRLRASLELLPEPDPKPRYPWGRTPPYMGVLVVFLATSGYHYGPAGTNGLPLWPASCGRAWSMESRDWLATNLPAVG